MVRDEDPGRDQQEHEIAGVTRESDQAKAIEAIRVDECNDGNAGVSQRSDQFSGDADHCDFHAARSSYCSPRVAVCKESWT